MMKKSFFLLYVLFSLVSVSSLQAGLLVGSGVGDESAGSCTWDLLDENCSDFSTPTWIDGDQGTGVSEISPVGQFRFDTNAGAAEDDYARRTADIGSYPDESTHELKLYHDNVGDQADTDNFQWVARKSGVCIITRYCSDGLFIKHNGSYVEVGTNLVKEDGAAEWQTWRFLVDFASLTCDVYLDDSTHSWEKVGTSIGVNATTADPDGQTRLAQYGHTTNDMVTHVDYIRAATGLCAPTGINPPTVTTQAVDGIHDTNATGHGTITATGGENCSKRGICWDTASMPTTSDSKAEDLGSYGTGAFSKTMTSLSSGTTYYVRAYALNSSGTSYGDQVQFDTTGTPPPGCSCYVDIGGDDGSGDGTSGNPWLTVGYALSQSSFGETICCNDGTYDEAQLTIPAGVSLISTSANATIVTLQPSANMGSYTPFLKLITASPGSDGNQTISYLTLDGNTGTYTARIGIKIENRNNVRIHHCNISDFSSGTLSHGVWVASTEIAQTDNWQNYWPYDPQEPGNDVNIDGVWPANPVSGFELDHNTITNCGYRVALSSGPIWCSVRLYHLKDSSIYDNTINVGNSKAQCICGICAILHNVDIYNNDLDMTHYSDRSSYIVEIWLLRNGCEIYNNEANACFSICAGKETKVYNNTILSTKIYTTGGNIGIECMIQTHGEIYNNYVQNAKTYGIDAGLSWRHGGYRVEDTAIYNNIIYNTYGTGICIQAEGSPYSGKNIIVSGLEIFNNTIDSTDQSWGLIRLEESDDVSSASMEVFIKNNILTNNSGGYAGKTIGTVSSTIDYNLFYSNGTNDWLNGTDTNTVVANPVYVAAGDKPDYFKIQTSSNAKDAGTNSVNGTVTDDYWGTARDASIDIGGHEYVP